MATTYTIRDTNSSDSGLTFGEAVERIASWYEDADQWADGQGDRETHAAIWTGIRSVKQPSKGDIDTLQAYADAVCDAVAKAMGHKEFAGQPSFGVASAAECGGFRLVVESEYENSDAYNTGFEASAQGEPRSANPYLKGSWDNAAWQAGWDAQ